MNQQKSVNAYSEGKVTKLETSEPNKVEYHSFVFRKMVKQT